MVAVSLASIGIGQASADQKAVAQAKTHTNTVTVTKTVTKEVPGPVQKVNVLSDSCRQYLSDTDQVLNLFSQWTASYGQLEDHMNNVFRAMAQNNIALLNAERITIKQIDSGASDAVSQIINLSQQIKTEKSSCQEAK